MEPIMIFGAIIATCENRGKSASEREEKVRWSLDLYVKKRTTNACLRDPLRHLVLADVNIEGKCPGLHQMELFKRFSI